MKVFVTVELDVTGITDHEGHEVYNVAQKHRLLKLATAGSQFSEAVEDKLYDLTEIKVLDNGFGQDIQVVASASIDKLTLYPR